MDNWNSLLEQYIRQPFDSEYEINIYKHHASGYSPWSEQDDQNHDVFCKQLGCDLKEGLIYKRLQRNWGELNRKFIIGLIERNDANELDDYIDEISRYLFAWSKELIIDDVLVKLAKYIISKQVTENSVFTLNRLKLNKAKQVAPASRPPRPIDYYISILMAYIELRSINKVAEKFAKDRATIREHLCKVAGTNFKEVLDGSHPEYDEVLIACEIWKSRQ